MAKMTDTQGIGKDIWALISLHLAACVAALWVLEKTVA